MTSINQTQGRVSAPPLPELESLRAAIQEEYQLVALEPQRGFHFHTGRRLARLLGYADEWLTGVPEASIESFAGTGNPFSLGALKPGEKVVDVGSGAGIDSLIAAGMVAPGGRVVGVDMTPAMLEKASRAAGGRRLGRCSDLQRCAQPGSGQICRLAGDGARSQSGRAPANWRHSGKKKRSRRAPGARSTFGPVELPALCWKQSSRLRS